MYAKLATAVAALATVLTAQAAAASAPYDHVTVDGTAVVVDERTVTTTGSYRCYSTTPEPVWITSSVRQGRTTVSGDAQTAVCDGQIRTWRVETRHDDVMHLRPGRATVQSTLMQLRQGQGLIPLMPAFLAADEREVDVTRW
ncbi:DUF6299 family protein [Streptomyces sp. NPDC050418]|uniref:DUF6299 family protein n=1 Tax=Streptomyces sp. NPDC050418 TaxID=3365612 RepID=UPI00378EDB5C